MEENEKHKAYLLFEDSWLLCSLTVLQSPLTFKTNVFKVGFWTKKCVLLGTKLLENALNACSLDACRVSPFSLMLYQVKMPTWTLVFFHPSQPSVAVFNLCKSDMILSRLHRRDGWSFTQMARWAKEVTGISKGKCMCCGSHLLKPNACTALHPFSYCHWAKH